MNGPGAVIVPCQETARFTRFTIALAELELPEGSHRIYGIGTSIVDNLNSAIRQLRDRDEWIWIVGDDHVFEPNTLLRLLDRDADIIAPLCTRRVAPFPLVHYGDPVYDGSAFYRVLQFDDLPDDGEPFEVFVTGSLMLIRREVLEAIGDPWFSTSDDLMNEEFAFCEKARELGYRILVDPAITVGHMSHVIALAELRDGVWGLQLKFPGSSLDEFYPGGMVTERVTAGG